MIYSDGAFDGTELSYRCTSCGDSPRHPSKAHCSVNIYTGVYYCLRCGASGKLASQDMSLLTRGLKIDPMTLATDFTHQQDDFLDTIALKLRTGSGRDRYSALDRYHIETQSGSKIDAFKSVLPCGTVIGYHFRPEQKDQVRTYGQKMFGISSKIRRDKPWRIVEGPYDCLDPHTDICCFGFPTEAQIKTLAGYRLIICPDGDVFEDYRKLKTFMKPFLYNRDVFVEYVERLPPNTDPDECLPSKRERLSFDQVRQMLTPKKTFFIEWMKPEQILEDIKNNQTEDEFWGIK